MGAGSGRPDNFGVIFLRQISCQMCRSVRFTLHDRLNAFHAYPMNSVMRSEGGFRVLIGGPLVEGLQEVVKLLTRDYIKRDNLEFRSESEPAPFVEAARRWAADLVVVYTIIAPGSWNQTPPSPADSHPASLPSDESTGERDAVPARFDATMVNWLRRHFGGTFLVLTGSGIPGAKSAITKDAVGTVFLSCPFTPREFADAMAICLSPSDGQKRANPTPRAPPRATPTASSPPSA